VQTFHDSVGFGGCVPHTSRVDENLGIVHRLDVREIWKSEPRQFTPWLAENIALLGATLGMDLDLVEAEVRVGLFAADLVAKDVSADRIVVIENQLEPTDHSHLGQLLTYGSGLGASVFIWVTPEFREEHRAALDWLNEHSDEGSLFFGVEVELLFVDDSRPAPHFNLISSPNEWRKNGRIGSSRPSERGEAYKRFFQALLLLFKSKYPGQTNVSRVGPDNWLSLSTGRAGVVSSWSFTIDRRFRVELYIDRGVATENKGYFDQLIAHRTEIETNLGHPLDWDRLETRRASRISLFCPDAPITVMDGGDVLESLRAWATDEMAAVRRVFGSYLAILTLSQSSSEPPLEY
jgi:hypothetical protein